MDWITGRLKEPTTYLALALAGVGLKEKGGAE
jgi:hypothetical protein